VSLRFILNVETVAIDEALSLTLSAADLREALQSHLEGALQIQALVSQPSRDAAHVEVPSLRSAADLSQAIATSLFSPEGTERATVGGGEQR
jgi:hypothetical protein